MSFYWLKAKSPSSLRNAKPLPSSVMEKVFSESCPVKICLPSALKSIFQASANSEGASQSNAARPFDVASESLDSSCKLKTRSELSTELVATLVPSGLNLTSTGPIAKASSIVNRGLSSVAPSPLTSWLKSLYRANQQL